MIKSTAAAGPRDMEAAARTYFLWEAMGKPVSVRLSLEVVDRMEREVLEAFRAITRRGSEIGGLLLGRSEASGASIIEDYELVGCEYTRGPLYLLSDEERARMEEMLRRRKGAGQPLTAMGFFRSNTRKELALDEEDLALFQQYFARPDQVFLLVKPFATKPGVAGFFIRESDGVRNQASYREFPFRRAELESGDFARCIVKESARKDAAAPAAPAADANGAPSPAQKPATRGTVLPFSLKREEEAPAPPKREDRGAVLPFTPKQEEAEPPAARKDSARKEAPVLPPLQPKEEKAPAPAAKKAEESKPQAAPKVQNTPTVKDAPKIHDAPKPKEEAPKPKESAQETAKSKAASPAAPLEEVISTPSPYGGKKLWALFGGLAMLALAGGTMVYLNSKPKVSSQPIVAQDDSGLQLRADRQGQQLVVTWNRDGNLVKTADKAVLAITDGAQKEEIQLDAGQLHSGSIVYTPVTGDVSFRLEVTDTKQSKSRSEFIRVLPAAPVTDESSAQKSTAIGTPDKPAVTPPKAPPSFPPASSQPADPEPTAPEVQAQRTAPSQPLRPFSIASRVRPAEQTELPEPPRVEATASAPASRAITPANISAPPPPAFKPATPAPAPAQPAAQQPAAQQVAQPQSGVEQPSRVGGKVTPPRVIRKIDPVYPQMARQARVGGTVRLQATVGKDGRVKKVEVLSGPPLLRQAAADAVQKWVYTPSTLNGTPIEANTQVDIGFNLANLQ